MTSSWSGSDTNSLPPTHFILAWILDVTVNVYKMGGKSETLIKNGLWETVISVLHGSTPASSPCISLATSPATPFIRKWECLLLGLWVATYRDSSPRISCNIWSIMNSTQVNKKWNTSTHSLWFFFFSLPVWLLNYSLPFTQGIVPW